MKSKKYLFIIFSALSFLSALMFYYDARTLLSNSAEAEAVITESIDSGKQQSMNNNVSDKDHNTYAIEFITADGKRIKSEINLSERNYKAVGGTVDILYNKNNPESVSVRYPLKVLYFSKPILLFSLSLIFDLAAFKIK